MLQVDNRPDFYKLALQELDEIEWEAGLGVEELGPLDQRPVPNFPLITCDSLLMDTDGQPSRLVTGVLGCYAVAMVFILLTIFSFSYATSSNDNEVRELHQLSERAEKAHDETMRVHYELIRDLIESQVQR